MYIQSILFSLITFSIKPTDLELKGTFVSWKGPNINLAPKTSADVDASCLLIDESLTIFPVYISSTSLWVITNKVTLSPSLRCFFKAPKHPNSISSG